MILTEAVRGGELRSLTSLRGLAAMAVVLQHFSATAQSWCTVNIPSVIPHGYVAVDFFFTLSGFIMAYTYEIKFKQLGLKAYGPFLANRAARVLPLNTFALILIVTIGAVCQSVFGQTVVYSSSQPFFDLSSNLLLLQGVGIGTNLNAPSWSISVEFLAYLFFPLLLGLLCKGSKLRWISSTVAVVVLFGLAAQTQHLLMTFEGPPWSLARCFAEFTLGIGALHLFRLPRIVSILRQDRVTIALSVAAAFSLLLQRDLPAVLLFPFVIVAYATNTDRAARLVQSRFFYFLGEISFSLYLLHNPIRPLELLLMQRLTGQPVGAAAALSFAILGAFSVIPIAWFGYQAVERPGRLLLRKALGGTKISLS